ncbi:MAG: hypothetical protein MJ050_08125 [Phascolarctobacterium sp.]|nr:hypothetical protein [Phascolarctobacterium sp.]
MKKKIASLALSLIFSMNAAVPVFAANGATLPAAEKVAAMEKMLYGTNQSGSLMQRMDSLEDDVYGTVTTNGVLERINNMYDYLDGDDKSEASFNTRLNVVEWKFQESMSNEPAKTRIEKLEKFVSGSTVGGSLSDRLDELTKLASYQNGSIPVSNVSLPKDSVIKIEFMETLTTKQSRMGDSVNFKAADNLYVNDVLVLPKGARGTGVIKKVSQPGIFGKDGKIDIEFTSISSIDGTQIPVTVGELSKQQVKTAAGAGAATIGGLVILGPVGLVGGAFVKGAGVTIPAGSFTFVQTASDVEIQGVVAQE